MKRLSALLKRCKPKDQGSPEHRGKGTLNFGKGVGAECDFIHYPHELAVHSVVIELQLKCHYAEADCRQRSHARFAQSRRP